MMVLRMLRAGHLCAFGKARRLSCSLCVGSVSAAGSSQGLWSAVPACERLLVHYHAACRAGDPMRVAADTCKVRLPHHMCCHMGVALCVSQEGAAKVGTHVEFLHARCQCVSVCVSSYHVLWLVGWLVGWMVGWLVGWLLAGSSPALALESNAPVVAPHRSLSATCGAVGNKEWVDSNACCLPLVT